MSEHNQNPTHKAVIDGLVIGMPGVKSGKAFGHAAYKVNGKIFSFIGDTGVMLKLPKSRVQHLIDTQPEMKPCEVAPGIIWKEWLTIERSSPDEYEQDIELFEESIQFVVG